MELMTEDHEHVSTKRHQLTELDIQQAFDMLDENKDGQISQIEFIKGLRKNPQLATTLGLPTAFQQESDARRLYQLTFGEMDYDHSKTIDYEEFRQFYSSDLYENCFEIPLEEDPIIPAPPSDSGIRRVGSTLTRKTSLTKDGLTQLGGLFRERDSGTRITVPKGNVAPTAGYGTLQEKKPISPSAPQPLSPSAAQNINTYPLLTQPQPLSPSATQPLGAQPLGAEYLSAQPTGTAPLDFQPPGPQMRQPQPQNTHLSAPQPPTVVPQPFSPSAPQPGHPLDPLGATPLGAQPLADAQPLDTPALNPKLSAAQSDYPGKRSYATARTDYPFAPLTNVAQAPLPPPYSATKNMALAPLDDFPSRPASAITSPPVLSGRTFGPGNLSERSWRPPSTTDAQPLSPSTTEQPNPPLQQNQVETHNQLRGPELHRPPPSALLGEKASDLNLYQHDLTASSPYMRKRAEGVYSPRKTWGIVNDGVGVRGNPYSYSPKPISLDSRGNTIPTHNQIQKQKPSEQDWSLFNFLCACTARDRDTDHPYTLLSRNSRSGGSSENSGYAPSYESRKNAESRIGRA